VALVTSSSVATQNGQPAPVNISRQTTYIASISINNTVNAGSQTSVTPGVVTTGFQMVVVPLVLPDGRILLQLNVQSSTLDAINVVNVGGQNGTSVGTPQISEQSFVQRLPLHAGDSFVLAGFQQVQDNAQYKGVLPRGPLSVLGGQTNDDHKKVTTVIVVTPYMIST